MNPPPPKSPRVPSPRPGNRGIICPLSPAHFTGFAAFHLYAILLFVDIRTAPLPLLAFLLACAVAPFLPRLGFFLPIVGRGKPGEKGVALTFDDGPDPEVTPLLLDLLDRHSVPATFFVTGERAARHPSILRDILSRGHAIGNHSYHHFPFLMLKGIRTLRREIESTQSVLAGFGIVPLAFRPPAGITNPLLRRVLLEQGMYCVNYSCRAVDIGNRRIGRLQETVLKAVSPGDIVALHDVAPRHAGTERLLAEFDALLRGLKEKGLEVVPLDRLIGRKVMRRGGSPGEPHPAALFYDGLAAGYDREQFCSPVSGRPEDRVRALRGAAPVPLFPVGPGDRDRRRHRHLHHGDRATLPGGDGRRHFREHAGDPERESRRGGTRQHPDDRGKRGNDGYRGVLYGRLRLRLPRIPGGPPGLFPPPRGSHRTGRNLVFHHRPPLPAPPFAQIGNAMRQGLWLKAHSRREIEAILSASGFEEIRIGSHLFKSWVSGGVLLEVAARRRTDPGTPAAP